MCCFKKKIIYDTSLGNTVKKLNALDIKVNQLNGFSREQRAFFLEALDLQKKVVNSVQFHQRFLDLPKDQMNGYTISSLYDKLMSGESAWDKLKDHDLDYHTSLYYTFKKTIGKTIMSTGKTFINRYWFKKWMKQKYGRAYLSGHTFHEYFHTMGLYHRRPVRKSIVYYAGYLMRDMCKEVIDKAIVLTPRRIKC